MVNTVIKIKRGGCGIKYMDANGNARHALKTPESGPFECDVEQAKRLVEKGVAELVSPWILPEGDATAEDKQQEDPDSQPNKQQEEPGEPEKLVGHLDAAELEKMDYNTLKKLAADMGVRPNGTKKADYLAALAAAEVELDEADMVDPDELPDLSAADPE